MFQFKYFNIPRTLSRAYCTRALQTLEKVVIKPQQGIINLIVIDSEEMARMNEKFRGKTGPTDILTFSYYDSEEKEKRKKKNEGIVSVTPTQAGVYQSSGMDSTSRSRARLAGMTEVIAGEIYLCLEKIKLYAKESGKTYKEQLEYIIIHGLTHLMGYDHETEDDWQEMKKIEKKIQSLLK